MSDARGVSGSAVVARGVTKTYRGGIRANDGIDLDIPVGEVFGLLGPNGAGKSTLVRQLVGLQRPDSGGIALFGHDIVAGPAAAPGWWPTWRRTSRRCSSCPSTSRSPPPRRMRGLSRRAAAVTATARGRAGFGAVADRPIVRLSGGQRRLACVAAALAAERPLLVVDEPTAGLDPVARRSVWAAIARRREHSGATVVLVTHNVLEAEAILDRVAVLDRGRVIACDTPGRLKASVSAEVRLELVWRDAAARRPGRGRSGAQGDRRRAAVEPAAAAGRGEGGARARS